MNRFSSLLLFSLLFILYSCNPYPDFEKHEGKLFSKFHKKNGGTKPEISDIAVIDLLYRTKDSVFYDSRSTGSPINLTINKPEYSGDLNQALQLMSAGDSATFIIRADSFFLRTLKYNRVPRGVTKDEMLFLEVKMHRFYTKEQREQEVTKWKQGLKAKENSLIAAYLSENRLHPDTLASGLMVIREAAGKGSTPQPGDKMKVNMTLMLTNGKEIYSSKKQNKPLLFEFGRQIENKGVEEALSMMPEGSRLQIIVPSALGFGEEGRGEFVPPYSPLVYKIEMLDIVTKAEEDKAAREKTEKAKSTEEADREHYLKANNIKVKPLPSGLYYVETKTGKGQAPKPGDKVKVHYTGYLTDGTKFDSSLERGQPYEFEVGKGRVIKGWDEGICLMKPGGKAKLVIPSKLGYGERGGGDKIGPYVTLVFDIELLSVTTPNPNEE